MPARLTVHFPQRPARAFVAQEGGTYLIGRDAAADLKLDDDRISRRHASLESTDGGWRIVDLESKNGTAVDGRRTAAAELENGCWLSLGGLLARFELLSESELARSENRRAARLETSLRLQRRLADAGSVEQLLERVLRSAVELAGAERGFVMLSQPDGDLEIGARFGITPPELDADEFSGSVGAIQQSLDTGTTVASSDISDHTELAARPSIIAGGIQALVCVPLTALERLIGVIYLDSRRPGVAFGDLEVEILDALASHAALALAVAGLDRELKGLLAELPDGELTSALETVWDRSLPAYRSGAAGVAAAGPPRGRWTELVARHGRRQEARP